MTTKKQIVSIQNDFTDDALLSIVAEEASKALENDREFQAEIEAIIKMTPNEMRIACAEACGWTRGFVEDQSFSDPSKVIKNERWIDPNGLPHRTVPDYPNDLNACAEMRKSLTCMAEQIEYAFQLHKLTISDNDRSHLLADYHCIGATPEQRCEAFLRVKALERIMKPTPKQQWVFTVEDDPATYGPNDLKTMRKITRTITQKTGLSTSAKPLTQVYQMD